MKKENTILFKRYEENEQNLNQISDELYSKEPTLDKLGNISLSLNDKMKLNEELLKEVLKTLEEYDNNSWHYVIIGTIMIIISLGLSFINIPVGLLLIGITLISTCKKIKFTEGEELKVLLLKVYGQKSRIMGYKYDITSKVKQTNKKINNNIWSGEELEMLFDISVSYVEMLLDGLNPNIASPYIESIVKELLKDVNHPNASIPELVKLAKGNNTNKVLERTLHNEKSSRY